MRIDATRAGSSAALIHRGSPEGSGGAGRPREFGQSVPLPRGGQDDITY
jgi:hypothetical protein